MARLAFRWPLAVDVIAEAIRTDRMGRLLSFFQSLVNETGNTFEQVLLGARGIDTQDPSNLEAILSTQFSSRERLQ